MFSFSDQNEPSQGGNTATRIWTRRLIILLTILAAFVLAVLILDGASHITTALLIFAVAALIAYAIAPVVVIFQRVMPRWLAILLVYLLVFILLGLVMYLVVNTAVVQIFYLSLAACGRGLCPWPIHAQSHHRCDCRRGPGYIAHAICCLVRRAILHHRIHSSAGNHLRGCHCRLACIDPGLAGGDPGPGLFCGRSHHRGLRSCTSPCGQICWPKAPALVNDLNYRSPPILTLAHHP